MNFSDMIEIAMERVFLDGDSTATGDHAKWKARLAIAIENEEILDVEEISADDCCKLGRWLHATKTNTHFWHIESYKHCVIAHAKFHIEAGKLAKIVNEKKIRRSNLAVKRRQIKLQSAVG